MIQSTASDLISVVERMFEEANRHDLEAFLAYFHPDYQSEAPVHPSRSFRGREIVRWARLYMEPVEAATES